MTRTTTHHLLLFAALLHLGSDLAYVGSTVLCVGPNEHNAVETEHASALGCPSVPSPGTAGYTDPSSAGDCSDSPLHSGAEIVSSSEDGSDVAAQLVAFNGAPQVDRLAPEPLVHTRARAPDLPPELRAHRTTVLLL